MSTEFLHIVIELSLRQIIAPDGMPITICQVESNAPILIWHEGPSEVYSLGKALKTDDCLCFDVGPFQYIIKRCADCICFCAIAPNDVEESIYHIQRIERGKVVSEDIPTGAIGKVSKGQRYEFDLMVGSLGQTFRIETVPSEDRIMGKSKIIWKED